MIRHVRPILAVLALALLVGTAHRAHAQQATRIAVVDLQRAFLEVDEGKAAKARLQKDFAQKQRSLDAQTEELRKMKEDLDRQSAVMDPAKRTEKENELDRKFREVQQTYMTLQTDLNKKQKDVMDKIMGKMDGILRQIAQQDGIDLILERSTLAYAKDTLDLTSELIRKYNARYGATGTAKKSGGAKKSGRKK